MEIFVNNTRQRMINVLEYTGIMAPKLKPDPGRVEGVWHRIAAEAGSSELTRRCLSCTSHMENAASKGACVYCDPAPNSLLFHCTLVSGQRATASVFLRRLTAPLGLVCLITCSVLPLIIEPRI